MAKAEVWLGSFKWPFNSSLLSVTVSTVIPPNVSQIKRNFAITDVDPSSGLTQEVRGMWEVCWRKTPCCPETIGRRLYWSIGGISSRPRWPP